MTILQILRMRIMIQKILITLILTPFISSNYLWAANLKSIDFKQVGEMSEFVFKLEGEDFDVSKFHFTEDKQIILDLKNTEADEKVIRAFDVSEFSGAVVFVSAYRRDNSPKDLRVAIQLRDNVRSVVKKELGRVVLEIENRFGVFTQQKVEENKTFEEKINEPEVGRVHIPKSDSVEDILENLTLAGRKKYIGKKISFNVRDVSVADLLKMIADASGFNIIITDELKKLPPLTLSLTNVPWDQALDTILGLNKLVAKKNGIILMITTLSKATEEKELEIKAKKITESEEPLVTKIFAISYAKIEDLQKIIGEYMTKERGKLSLDTRTNSLIVKDTIETIEKIKKIIETLDTQTPQVLIESKIIEVQESHSKSIGLSNGFNFGYDPMGFVDRSATPVNVGGTLGGGTAGFQGGPGFQFSSASSGTSGAMGLTISRFNRFFNLNFALNLLESESKGRIISSPKVITENKRKAEITSTDTTSFAVVTGVGDAATRSFETIDAKLNLAVTPQVTNEGSISMEVELTKEQFGAPPQADAPPDKAQRSIKTNVLVENGSTVVIGGVYNYQKEEFHSGIPFLKDLPLIGWAFRTPYNPIVQKNELVIFLTPRIINQEEAGLAPSQNL
jgi:type IV pilus assembly protein PilQ